MPLAMGLWREHLPDLVCLIVYRDPVDNVRSLLSSFKGGACQTCFPVVCVHLLLSHALANSTSCSCDYAQFHFGTFNKGPCMPATRPVVATWHHVCASIQAIHGELPHMCPLQGICWLEVDNRMLHISLCGTTRMCRNQVTRMYRRRSRKAKRNQAMDELMAHHVEVQPPVLHRAAHRCRQHEKSHGRSPDGDKIHLQAAD